MMLQKSGGCSILQQSVNDIWKFDFEIKFSFVTSFIRFIWPSYKITTNAQIKSDGKIFARKIHF